MIFVNSPSAEATPNDATCPHPIRCALASLTGDSAHRVDAVAGGGAAVTPGAGGGDDKRTTVRAPAAARGAATWRERTCGARFGACLGARRARVLPRSARRGAGNVPAPLFIAGAVRQHSSGETSLSLDTTKEQPTIETTNLTTLNLTRPSANDERRTTNAAPRADYATRRRAAHTRGGVRGDRR